MTDSTGQNTDECFTDFALQEYVLGRLASEIRDEVVAHLKSCPACTACVNLFQMEAGALTELLANSPRPDAASPIATEELAMFLDNSLDKKARQRLHATLADSPEELSRLIAVYREVQASRDHADTHTETREIPEREPEGRIIRMPKRQVIPKSILDLPSSESGFGA